MENLKIDVKKVVHDKYSVIASQDKKTNESSCCGASSCCSTVDYAVFSDDYTQLKGYNPDADLGLGCGLPTEYAKMKAGDSVLDLGSGAGNDCFVARWVVGESGKVIGLDFTEAMLEKARNNAQKLNLKNVEFIFGDIEDMPLNSNQFDVVISNCVLNLVSDKSKAFEEIYRVLKPGGHFSISDVVLAGELPKTIREAAEMYAGCVSGAMQKHDYLSIIKNSGFKNIVVQKEKTIDLPDDILKDYLSDSEIKQYRESDIGVFSITVYADK